jgi:hypothetical protein
MAGSQTLFSDLGPAGNVYQCCNGWTVSGTGTVGTSFTPANEFSPSMSGSVSEIDVAVGYVTGLNSFYVALDSDNGGIPGAQLGYWGDLTSSTNFGSCCGIISITGITGINLTAGENYWLVVGPMNVGDTTWEAWNLNNQGAMGTEQYSTDGGDTWNSNGTQTLGAFQIVGGTGSGTTPEPSSLLLMGSGLLGGLGLLRRKINL